MLSKYETGQISFNTYVKVECVVVCGSAEGEGWSSGLRDQCWGRLAGTVDLHHANHVSPLSSSSRGLEWQCQMRAERELV